MGREHRKRAVGYGKQDLQARESGARAPIKALEAERDSIALSLAAMVDEGRAISLHPAAVQRYLADVERLAEVIADNPAGQSDELITIVRRLISTVTVHAKPGRGPVTIEFRGRLSELIEAPRRGLHHRAEHIVGAG